MTDIRRNRIGNGCMQISQENGNAAQTVTARYLADQWEMLFVTSVGAVTGQRVQERTPAGALDRLRISVTAADTSLAAGEHLLIRHKIEGCKVSDLLWGTSEAKDIVLRFMGSMPGQLFCVSVTNAAGDRSYVVEVDPTAANTDEVFEIAIPGDASGSWPTGDQWWGSVNIAFATEAETQTTADAWQSGNYFGTSGMANGLASDSNVFEIGDVGLKADPDSTGIYGSFEVPDKRETLRDCQKLYPVFELGPGVTTGISTANAPNTAFLTMQFPVEARREPKGIKLLSGNINWYTSDTRFVSIGTLHYQPSSRYAGSVFVTGASGMEKGQAALTISDETAGLKLAFTGSDLGLARSPLSIFGDSMVVGISYDIPSQQMVQVVNWYNHFHDIKVYGVSGARVLDVLSSLQANPYRRSAIILLCGFNDLKRSDFDLTTCTSHYQSLYNYAATKADRVICVGVPPMVRSISNIWYPEGSAIPDQRFVDVNAAIQSIAVSGFIDPTPGWSADHTNDGIHPNATGAKYIAGKINLLL